MLALSISELAPPLWLKCAPSGTRPAPSRVCEAIPAPCHRYRSLLTIGSTLTSPAQRLLVQVEPSHFCSGTVTVQLQTGVLHLSAPFGVLAPPAAIEESPIYTAASIYRPTPRIAPQRSTCGRMRSISSPVLGDRARAYRTNHVFQG